MTPERYQQIGELCQAALEREPEQRAAFLDQACTGDEDLRQEVESLLAADAQAGSFIAKPALEMAAGVMAAEQAREENLVRIGQTLAHYRIEEQIGRGGMGVVYRATDTKLGRQVAIKVLPQIFASDPERLARFEREARMLASLNHPNIAAIYGVEEAHEIHCLVLELAPGEDLNRRLASGRMPIEEALAICLQITESLEAAHDRGIIHRDLKPSNVKVTPEGKVKVLDFGLAKAVHGNPTDSGLTDTADDTLKGVVQGTAAYMSPEQARGRALDKRTDIWAFGCVLYETLAGRRAFAGETTSDCMAAVLTREPDWTALPVDTPRSIMRLLRHCLQKDPQRRLRDIGDARIEMEDALNEPKIDVQALSSGLQWRRLPWTALALVTLIIALAVIWIRRPIATAPLVSEARFELSTPPTTDPVSLAISPDGQKIVFVAVSEGQSALWIRSLDSVSARPLAGTDGAMFPFWSPNSRSVGFFAQGKLKRIETVSGFVETLANALAGRGGSWSADGTIIFSASPTSPIFRLPPTGSEPVELTRLDLLHHGNHRFPHFFPDGKHFLYYAQGSPETRGFYVGELDGPESRPWLDADDTLGGSVWLSDGKVLFIRNGTLFAQNFDPVRLALTGNPFLVAAPPPGGPPIRVVSASAAGPIAYRQAPAGGLRQLVWFDRSGKEIRKVGGPGYGIQPKLSPDGRFVAMRIHDSGNTDITLLEIGRSVLTRFTFDPGLDIRGVWSPDGSRIVFCSNRKGIYNLYGKLTTGSPGSEELLLETARTAKPQDWSLDGRFLLYSQEEKSGDDLWALPLDGDRKPFPVVQTNYDESWSQFSPDGKWIAYASNESGQYEIYVQPFSGKAMVGGKRQISVNGGSFVQWRRDGKELFYIAPDNRLMAVAIRLAPARPAVESDAPIPLFATRLGGAWQAPPGREYVVSADGRRFLMNTSLEEPVSPISVILNWKAKP